MLPSRPPLPEMAISVTWSDTRYQQCLDDYLLGQGPLSSREVCDVLRWVAEDPWYRAPVSLGERRLPLFIPRLGIPQVVPAPARTKEDLLHEPTIRQVPTSTKKVVRVKSWQDWVKAGGELPPNWNKFPTPKEYQKTIFAPNPGATVYTGGSEVAWDLGNITGRVIDIGLAALQSRVVKPIQLAGPAAKAAGAAAAATLGVTAIDEIFFDDEDKKHRHRRKRLATVSDIKDLAALKAVLGNGEAFKTWIATHSR